MSDVTLRNSLLRQTWSQKDQIDIKYRVYTSLRYCVTYQYFSLTLLILFTSIIYNKNKHLIPVHKKKLEMSTLIQIDTTCFFQCLVHIKCWIGVWKSWVLWNTKFIMYSSNNLYMFYLLLIKISSKIHN